MAHEEKAETSKVLKMCLVHDFPKTRLLNQTFIQDKIYSLKDKQSDTLKKQLRGLKGSEELQEAFNEFMKGETKEAKIVRDSNTLEALIEAKEYAQQGVKIMDIWFTNKEKDLRTETGKKIFAALKNKDIFWWKGK